MEVYTKDPASPPVISSVIYSHELDPRTTGRTPLCYVANVGLQYVVTAVYDVAAAAADALRLSRFVRPNAPPVRQLAMYSGL